MMKDIMQMVDSNKDGKIQYEGTDVGLIQGGRISQAHLLI